MRIASLVFTPFAEDARVQRTAEALGEAGHEVLVVARPPFREEGPYRRHELSALVSRIAQTLGLVATRAPATLLPALAPTLYWLPLIRREALRAMLDFWPDIALCNAWNTLPVGAAVNRRTGARLVHDAHELATREHIQNWKWRLASERAVRDIEGRNRRLTDLVITVSEGIARSLQALYGRAHSPIMIRNLRSFQEIPFRPIEPPLTVLSHGLIRQERGLGALATSVTLSA